MRVQRCFVYRERFVTCAFALPAEPENHRQLPGFPLAWHVPVSMADKIARCPASADTTIAACHPLAPSRPVNSGRCEHHQRAAGTFNGSTRPFSLSLSLFVSVPPLLFFSLLLQCVPPPRIHLYPRQSHLPTPVSSHLSGLSHGPLTTVPVIFPSCSL